MNKKEIEWIVDRVKIELASNLMLGKTKSREYWNKQEEILRSSKPIPKEAWNWKYDLAKSEIKLMKSIYEKITSNIRYEK